jgi:replicative DNA helicase
MKMMETQNSEKTFSGFDKTIEKIDSNRKNDVNCLPIGLKRFEPYFQGILQACYYLITASSGIGKSKFSKAFFIDRPYEFYKNNQHLNLKLKIFYFSLEESREKFFLSLISTLLYKKYKISKSIRDLKSIGEGNKIDDDLFNKIKELKPEIDKLEDIVEVIDNIRNPYGIYKHVKEYMDLNGEIKIGKRIVEGKEREIKVYEPKNPNTYVIIITDHLSLLQPEKGSSLFDSMLKYSSEYCLHLRDFYKCTVVNVQQQTAAKEAVEYNFKGNSIEAKLEPSLDSLADCKLTQRDCDVAFGLFAPERYEIKNHRGYDITILQDTYRQLAKLKDRDGEANVRIGLHFKGEVNYFEELPKAEEFLNNPYLYENYKN